MKQLKTDDDLWMKRVDPQTTNYPREQVYSSNFWNLEKRSLFYFTCLRASIITALGDGSKTWSVRNKEFDPGRSLDEWNRVRIPPSSPDHQPQSERFFNDSKSRMPRFGLFSCTPVCVECNLAGRAEYRFFRSADTGPGIVRGAATKTRQSYVGSEKC